MFRQRLLSKSWKLECSCLSPCGGGVWSLWSWAKLRLCNWNLSSWCGVSKSLRWCGAAQRSDGRAARGSFLQAWNCVFLQSPASGLAAEPHICLSAKWTTVLQLCRSMFNSEQNSVNLEMDGSALWEQPWAAGPAEGKRWHRHVSTRWPLSKPHPSRSSVRSRLLKSTPFYAARAVIAHRRTVTARAATPALPRKTTMERGTRSVRGEGGFQPGSPRLGRAARHTDCVTPGATARRTRGQRSHLRQEAQTRGGTRPFPKLSSK